MVFRPSDRVSARRALKLFEDLCIRTLRGRPNVQLLNRNRAVGERRAAERCKAWWDTYPGYMANYCRAWRQRKREEALAAQAVVTAHVAAAESVTAEE